MDCLLSESLRVLWLPTAHRRSQPSHPLKEAALRANAWASGDVATLRRLITPGHQASLEACQDLLMSSKYFQDGTSEAVRRADIALRKALARNPATMALMPIEVLFRPDGFLAGLRRDGYRVEEPDQPS